MTSPSVAVGERELLPCPFCGDPPVRMMIRSNIGCMRCEYVLTSKRWNRRAALQASHAPVREPTEAMLKAGTLVFMREQQKRIPKWEPEIAGRFWIAMYDAAAGTTPEPKL